MSIHLFSSPGAETCRPFPCGVAVAGARAAWFKAVLRYRRVSSLAQTPLDTLDYNPELKVKPAVTGICRQVSM